MLKFSRLPIGILALTIAGPVFAAEPAATMAPQPAAPAATMAPQPAAPGATTSAPSATHQTSVSSKAAMVDINSATASDLKGLPGITDAEAAKIVQGRPYKDPADLVSKKVLSESEYNKIKDRLVAGHSKS